IHACALPPERRVVALGGLVMQDQEIADAFVFEAGLPVVLVHQHRVAVAIREHRQQPADAGLDQVDAGGFQRLHETGGQTQRYAVALPRLASHAGGEAQWTRRAQCFAVEVGQQHRAGFVVAEML
ncbi:hypothetical protein KO13_14540, partial [Listeria monocytogenes]